ncbi:hypothetical protein Egran_02403 [Elaphomyces granulatus]|uniref:Ig-like domain-containing protein n=1 Tax=Elaphomyces granulatus TaxID=519963 RepID=A0A232M0A5_9EURO|nr:hypothetical protein Egran_02403 [Elaphomyces granulatus]
MQTPAKLSIFLLLLLLIKWVYANKTVTLFLPLIPRAPLVASVAGSDSTATTYVLKCAPSPSVFCAIPQNFTLTEGPSTACYTVAQVALGVTSSLNCKYSGTTTAECSGGTASGGVTSTTLSSDSMEAFFQQVVVTASDTTCTSTSAHTTTVTGATAASTTGLSVDSRSTTVSGSVAAVSTAGAAGVPRVTGGSQFVLGGAGMALAAILAVIAL